ncbi:probable leucine-rich repeat receptor-like protein kinase At1g35710 [Lycium ferocissimum]|uniref:probable leucine-rich repeat receptor-like protein kinase At1g35710 n=1 Tax=Lycium ferocissimum TaxID=112874 RepID=UPI0028157381|nr:probable leucine-rich repeat receptor-like protein kinase At1g35710 [Lycium ferocissimum]
MWNPVPSLYMLLSLSFTVFQLVFAKYHFNTSETSSSANVLALLSWKASLESESQLLLSSWMNTSTSPCHWDCIRCDNLGRVTEMNMPNYLIKEFGMLESLFLLRTYLTGAIPVSIGNLSSLSLLYLDENKFSGHIPQEIAMLSSLKGLFLSRNTFIGSIPTLFGNLTNLESLKKNTKADKSSSFYRVTKWTSTWVKKFHPLDNGELNSLKSFESETKTLLKIRHHNVVKLYGFCSHARHSFLVYEFLEGGSLSERLRNDEKATELDCIKRVNIVRGVAYALSYMHHECSPPILHRDISSKNVLLDCEDKPRVSDFGTAKHLKSNSSNWTSFAGTFGYVAPEFAYTMEVNKSCDTYSFGVLSLKVILGRHPADIVEAMSSLSSTSEILDILLKDFIDQRPLLPSRVAEELIKITKIAFTCLNPSPQLRPTMQQVSASLAKEKALLKNSFPFITLGQLIDAELGSSYLTSCVVLFSFFPFAVVMFSPIVL